MIEVPFAFATRGFVCAARDAIVLMCMALGRGQPNRALIKGTVLVPSRRDLPGAVIPGKIDADSARALARSEPKVADEPGKLEPFD